MNIWWTDCVTSCWGAGILLQGKMFMLGNVLQGYKTGRTFRRYPFKLTSAVTTHIKCILFCVRIVQQIKDSRCWKLKENGIDILLNASLGGGQDAFVQPEKLYCTVGWQLSSYCDCTCHWLAKGFTAKFYVYCVWKINNFTYSLWHTWR